MRRQIRIEGSIAYVPLTQGYEAVIDAEDVPKVDGLSWCARVARRKDGSIWNVYALSNSPRSLGKQRTILMHRVIADTPAGMVADHIDGNGLNNRKANLRAANFSQNCQNQRVSTANTSGVKGATWNKRRGKWQVRIAVKETKRSGYYSRIEDAAAQYAVWSAELHGEFGRIA